MFIYERARTQKGLESHYKTTVRSPPLSLGEHPNLLLTFTSAAGCSIAKVFSSHPIPLLFFCTVKMQRVLFTGRCIYLQRGLSETESD